MSFPGLTGLMNSVSAVVVEAEVITLAERSFSLTMSPDHLEGEHPRRSVVEKQFLYVICQLASAGCVSD
jgi:hypothetical protein